MTMTAQEFIDVIVVHYNGAPDDEAISIGHWHAPDWSRPVEHFVPQVSTTVGELRAMASERAIAASGQLRTLRNNT